jgi:hypothetical protein
VAVIVISPAGEVLALAHPDHDRRLLSALGPTRSRRPAGRVLPARPALKAAWRALRALGRPGRALSRRLPGPWLAELPDGTVLGPFPSRPDALRAEEAAAARILTGGKS